MNPRILTFLVVCQLTPRGYNHAILTEEDLIMMYFIMNKVKIIWIHVTKDHMNKSKRITYHIVPYVVLVFKMIEHFDVNLEEELDEKAYSLMRSLVQCCTRLD